MLEAEIKHTGVPNPRENCYSEHNATKRLLISGATGGRFSQLQGIDDKHYRTKQCASARKRRAASARVCLRLDII